MPTSVTISRATQLQLDNDNDGVADAGDIIRTYLHILNTGVQDALNLVVNDNFTGSTLIAGSVKITPIAFDDTYTGVTGNTPITYGGAQGVLANDVDPDGAGGNAGVTVTQVNGVSIGGVIAITGGTVDMHADGSFTFTPTTGFNGTATFNYGVVDAQGLNNVTTGTVNIQVNGGMIWYVDNAYGGENGASDGSYLKPFTNFNALNDNGTGAGGTPGTADGIVGDDDVDGAGSTIFVYHNNAAHYATGIALEAGQSLIGDGNALLVNGHNIGGTERTGGVDNVATNAIIDHATYGVQLATDNIVKGVDLVGTAAGAIGISDGNASVTTGANTAVVSNVGISGQGQIVDIDQGGTLNVTLTSAASTSNSNGAGNGAIDLNGVQGSFTVTGATTINSSVSSQTGGGIDVTAASGTLAVALQGNVTVNTGATDAINFSNNVLGSSSLTLSAGTKDITTTTGNAVTMTGNTGTTESFTGGGLNIDTTTGTGLNVGGGTINIAGANNTIDTTTGPILVATNAAVGGSNVTFASLTAAGPSATTGNAIDINNLDGGFFTSAGVTIANTGTNFDAIHIVGGSSTAFTFNGNTDINGVGANGDGVELNGANGAVSFNNLTVDGMVAGTGNGLLINGATNTVTVTNGAIGTGANTGDAVNITSGTGAVAIGANISKNSAGNLIEINGHNSGQIDITGTLSATGSTNSGILLAGNTGGIINFTHSGTILTTGGANNAITMSNTAATGATVNFTGGGLVITNSGSGAGITTSSTTIGAGTINVTGTGNTINATSGTALGIVNTNIGANDVTFQSITSGTGAASDATGIILDNTGASGGLHVTGTGIAGSGGTIQHKDGSSSPDGSTTTGIGIYLNNTYDVQLNRMQLNDFNNFAIRGNNVNNFTLADSTINGVSGSVTSGADEAAIRFDGLFGQANITNSNLQGGYEYIVKVLNSSGTLDRFTVSNTTIGNNHDSNGGNGGDGFQVVASGTATVNVTLANDIFQGAGANVVNLTAQNSANMGVDFHNNAVTNSHANQAGASSNLLVFSTSTGNVTYSIRNNTLVADTVSAIHNTSNGIAVAKGIPDSGSGGTMSGVIDGNTIGQNGVANSGSQFVGIFASALGSGTHTTVISNNNIYHYNEEAIRLVANDPATGGNSVLNATVLNNDALQPDSLAFAGLAVIAGSGSGTETNVINLTIGDANNAAAKNDFSAGDPFNATDVDMEELGSGSIINLSTAGSAAVTPAAVVQADNQGTTTVGAFGTINLVSAASYRVIASPATVYEDGATNIVYTFIRHGDTTSAATINFSVGGTATFGSDYSQTGAATFTTTTGSVTFAAGSSTAVVTLDPTPDAGVESKETIILTITSAGAASPTGATTAIIDSDTTPLLLSPDAGAHQPGTPGGDGLPSVADGDSGAGIGALGGHPSPTGPTGGPATVDVGSLTGLPAQADDGVVSQAELNLIVDAAIQRWTGAGLSSEQLAAMRAVSVTVSDMMGLYVGSSSAGQIHIDSDGAGYGWFVDTTPGGDSEFEGSGTRLTADPGGPADQRIDLLTVVMHELGHQIGLDDTYAAANFSELMYGYVNPGERRLPGADDAQGAVAGSLTHEEYAVGPIAVTATLPAGKGVDVIFDSTVNIFANQVIPVFHNQATLSGTNLNTSPVTSNVEDLIVDTLTLGDKIFLDVNANGVFDAGDTAVAGVALTLYADSNGNGVLDGAELTTVLATTTTNGSGIYSFAGLAPGDYVVSLDASNFAGGGALLGKISAPGGVDPDDNADNDDNGIAGPGGTIISAPIRLDYNSEPTAGTGNDTNNTLDFGFQTPNHAPVFAGLDGAPSFTENGAAVVLDGNATVSDADLTATNYAGATLTLARSGGAVAEDLFGGTGGAGLTLSGGNASVNGTIVGTFTQSGGTLAITFNASATQALVNSALQGITYSNSNDTPPASAVIAYVFSDGNAGAQGTGGALTATGSVTVSITATDDLPVAVTDAYATNENAVLNVAAASGVLVNDTDPDGGPKLLASVNGNVANVGVAVTLASGAKVTLNADGSLSYDPNGQFNTLTNTSSGETGAVNTSAVDSFTYALNGGSSTTVNVTVNGVASPEDHFNGDAGANTITGTGNGDYFDLSQGGNDTASGLGGNDGFFFGAAFTAADQVDGGAGTNDQIGLQGNYTGGNALVLGPNSIANIEAIVVLPGFSYSITTNDANVAAGAVLKVQATQLAAGQSLTFNGAAETDGSFMIYGGQGNDNFTGGAGNDGFYFGPGGFNGSDIVNGGAGTNDQLGLDGDYTLTLGGNVTNIEALVLLHGPAATPNHFDITSGNAFVAAGQTMTIFGLQVETSILFNGAGELDGAFKIYGGTNADTLTGGAGADWLFGGNGADGLTGGAGNDVFYYDAVAQSTPANADIIFDFATGDKVDVSGIDAITGGADDAFTFLGAGAFTNHAGELRAENTGGSTWLVQGDTNGDGVADFQLTLITSDAHPIATGDFTL